MLTSLHRGSGALRAHLFKGCGRSVLALICSAAAGIWHAEAIAASAYGTYLDRIGMIKAYDVTIRVVDLAFLPVEPSSDQPVRTQREIKYHTLRDVFAWNVGRRLEHQVRDGPVAYMVASWRDFKPGTRARRNLSPYIPGLVYTDYLNPFVGNEFLSELLAEVGVRAIEVSGDGGMREPSPGIEVSRPDKRGFVRVWFAADKGGMLKRLQWFVENRGTVYLDLEVEISNYIEVKDGVWMPGEGTMTYFTFDKDWRVIPRMAYRMSVVENAIILNPENAVELVREESLPSVNYRDKSWACYYDPEVLAALKAADDHWDAAVWKSTWKAWVRRTLTLAIAISFGIFLIRALRFKGRKAPT